MNNMESFSGNSEDSEFRKINNNNNNNEQVITPEVFTPELKGEQEGYQHESPPDYNESQQYISNDNNNEHGISLDILNPNISLDINDNKDNKDNNNTVGSSSSNNKDNNNNNNNNNNQSSQINNNNKKKSTFKNRIDFSFKDINHSVTIVEKKKKVQKQILSNINGHIRAGEVFAILGPSGAGKTTLLDILAHRLNINGSGTMYLNGNKSNFNIFKRLCGYVTQNDNLMSSLTVRETLNFYAQLKMPRNVPLSEKLQRVQDVIDEMGLNRCAETLVGTSDNRIRGISGGERRRVTISIELLTSPSVLFLDEPTSGLDASTSFYVMSALKKLARSGRTIICTIHQPRSNIYDMFDRLLLLGDGNTIYYGHANKALEYFNNNGYHCNEKTNVADFFLDLINTQVGDQLDDEDDEIDNTTGNERLIGDEYDNVVGDDLDIGITSSGITSPTMGGTGTINGATNNIIRKRVKKLTKDEMAILKKEYPNSTQGIQVNEILNEITRENKTDFKFEKVQGPTFFTQFRLLLRRELLNARRHPMAFKVQFFQSCFQGILCGIVYYQLGLGQSSVQSRTGVLAFVIMGIAFPSTMSCIHVFPDVIAIFLKDKASGVYNTLPFFLAKSFMDVCNATLLPIITGTIVYWMTNQRVYPFFAVEPFFRFLLILVSAGQAALSLGVLISSSVPNAQVGMAVAPLLVILFFLFSGFFINLNDVPGWLVWFPYISFFKYIIEAAVINAFQNVEFTCTDSQMINGRCPIEYGNNVITNMGYSVDHFWRNIWILLLFVLGFRTITFLVLKLKSRNKFVQNE